MVSENLLATYSLLSFINDQKGDDKGQSLVRLFVPLVQQSINWMLREKGLDQLQGRNYTEIKSAIKKFFDFEMPIQIIDAAMHVIFKEDDAQQITINKDHSFIIKQGFAVSLEVAYEQQRERVAALESHYNTFCKREGITADFQGLMDFIQDQKNRIFGDKETVVDQQDYHISKYVRECIRRKDRYYDIICNLYLGGIIASYYKFQINERVTECELLWDTNFYISLRKLNTLEAYDTCQQLLDITTAMGYRFTMLQRTIEQIGILITNKANKFESKDYLAPWDEADILAACNREKMSKSQLLLVKDTLLEDLRKRGVTIIYDANIKDVIETAEKSPDLGMLSKIRGNRESALNDIIAEKYIEKRRRNKRIAEFNDVNCWFLNNSFSLNKKEMHQAVWQRSSISAPDLLLLLWLANPSLIGKENKNILAISSLSANIFKYRSGKMPSSQVIDEIQDRVSRLQITNQVSQTAVARLCIRMSEGCIQDNEAQRLIQMSTEELTEYMNQLKDSEDAYMEISEENSGLRRQNEDLGEKLLGEKVKRNISEKRFWTFVYLLFIFGLYWVYRTYINGTYVQSSIWSYVIQTAYWIVCIGMNFLNHHYLWLGMCSFIRPKYVEDVIRKRMTYELRNAE